MKLTRPPNREAPEPIIALIDVVFFLLVFFMLIGRMDATAPFDVDPPLAESGADMPGGGATLSISAAGATAINGVTSERSEVLKQIAQQLAEKPDLLVRINAHKNAPLRSVLPLAAEIEAMGAGDIVLVVTPGSG